MFTPTKSSHRQHVEPVSQRTPEFKKGNVILMDGVQKIVIAKLAADAECPVRYSVCDTDLRNSVFGISLDNATLAHPDEINDITRRRALNFV